MLPESQRRNVFHADTDPAHLIPQVYTVSWNMCARLNAMLDPRWGTFKAYLSLPGYNYPVRVHLVKPSYAVGMIAAEIETLDGEMMEVEVLCGPILEGTMFQLYFT